RQSTRLRSSAESEHRGLVIHLYQAYIAGGQAMQGKRPLMSMRLCGVLWFGLCAGGLPIRARAEDHASQITVEQAVRSALVQQPRLKTTRFEQVAAQARVARTRAEGLPQLGVSAQLNRATGNVVLGSLFAMPGVPNVSGPPRREAFDTGVWSSAAA